MNFFYHGSQERHLPSRTLCNLRLLSIAEWRICVRRWKHPFVCVRSCPDMPRSLSWALALRTWRGAPSVMATLWVSILYSRQDFGRWENWNPTWSIQEDILSEMIKKGSAAGGGFALGSLLGSKGTKFNGLDVKRVYFGYVVKPICLIPHSTFSSPKKLVTWLQPGCWYCVTQEVASSSECYMNASITIS